MQITLVGMILGLLFLVVAAVGLVALFGLLAWIRSLHHKETLALLERGGDLNPIIEMRERSRTRTGILVGAVLLMFGAALLVLLAAGLVGKQELGAAVSAGVILTGTGLIVLVAHLVWSRSAGGAESRRPPVPASNNDSETQENQR